LTAWFLAAGTVTLTMLLAAMSVGAVAAVMVGLAQVPSKGAAPPEPRLERGAGSGVFLRWRSLQEALRPTALLLSRVLVANVVSLPAVGVLESGGSCSRPLRLIINGAGCFLLAGFAAGERSGGGSTRTLANRAAVMLGGVTVFGGAAVALFARPLGKLMTGGEVDPLLLLGRVTYLGALGGGAAARSGTSPRGVVRRTVGVPWLMALGGVCSFWRLRALALRTREPRAGHPVAHRFSGDDDHPAGVTPLSRFWEIVKRSTRLRVSLGKVQAEGPPNDELNDRVDRSTERSC
jgi:hypothetical protein